jgi:hypothetical protein
VTSLADKLQWSEKTYHWKHENGKAMRAEIQMSVSDGEWTEVTLVVFGVANVGERLLFRVEFLVLKGLLRLTKLVFHRRILLNVANPF